MGEELKRLKIEIKELNELNIEKDRKIIEKDREIIKKDRKIMEKNIFLKKLFNECINKIEFLKINCISTDDTVKDKKIINENTNSEFKLLSNIDDYINRKKLNTIESSFLNECNFIDNKIEFCDEKTIQTKIVAYINDIIRGTNLEISIIEICSSIKKKNSESLTPDVCIIVKNKYKPILVIEVKSPKTTIKNCSCKKVKENESILKNENVLEQLYEYMSKQHSFCGQKHVFGILTTLDEWKICWLPESNDAAISNVLIDDNIDNNIDFEFNREIISSKTFNHTTKNLARIILSVIVKSYYSPCFPINIFSTKRHYIKLTTQHWLWTKYKDYKLEIMNNNLNFNIPHHNTSSFVVLKYFYSGTHSRVRLCISESGSIVIIKSFINANKDISSEELSNQELIC